MARYLVTARGHTAVVEMPAGDAWTMKDVMEKASKVMGYAVEGYTVIDITDLITWQVTYESKYGDPGYWSIKEA